MIACRSPIETAPRLSQRLRDRLARRHEKVGNLGAKRNGNKAATREMARLISNRFHFAVEVCRFSSASGTLRVAIVG